MAFDRQRSIPEPITESDDGSSSLWDIDWDDPGQVRALITGIDAKNEAEDDPDHPHTQWRSGDRQRRVSEWEAAFFQLGVTPPDGWEDWVR
jgi:hypothetical protein